MGRYPDFYFDPGSDFPFNDSEAFQMGMRFFWGIMTTILAVTLLVGVVCLVFRGMGLMRMAKRKGIPNGWLGFIPIANLYTLGKVSAMGRKRSEIPLLVLGILSALFTVASLFSIVPLVDIIFQASLAAPRGNFAMDYFPERLASVFGLSAATYLITAGLAIATMVLRFTALHRVYKQFSPDSATVMTVFTVIGYTVFGIPIHPFMLFAVRNNEIWPMGKPPYGYQGQPYPPNIPSYEAGAAYNPPPYAPSGAQEATLKPPAQGYASTHETSSPGYTAPLEPPAQGYATSIDPPEKPPEPPDGE